MSRDWQPGDVATFAGEVVFFTDEGEWLWATTGLALHRQEDATSEARPLVVIDPEDREQVQRLLATYYSAHGPVRYDDELVGGMQAALRELANPTPPRIDEPGRWGIVEASCVHTDRRMQWVHHADDNWWPFVNYNDGDERRPLPDDWDSLVDPVLVRDGVA